MQSIADHFCHRYSAGNVAAWIAYALYGLVVIIWWISDRCIEKTLVK